MFFERGLKGGRGKAVDFKRVLMFCRDAAWTGRQGEGVNLGGTGHGAVWKRILKDFELKNGWL